jgi:hypothetical protein
MVFPPLSQKSNLAEPDQMVDVQRSDGFRVSIGFSWFLRVWDVLIRVFPGFSPGNGPFSSIDLTHLHILLWFRAPFSPSLSEAWKFHISSGSREEYTKIPFFLGFLLFLSSRDTNFSLLALFFGGFGDTF